MGFVLATNVASDKAHSATVRRCTNPLECQHGLHRKTRRKVGLKHGVKSWGYGANFTDFHQN